MPEEDLHLSDLARSQAHSPGVHALGPGNKFYISAPFMGLM